MSAKTLSLRDAAQQALFTAEQVLADMQAQDLMMEWQTALDESLVKLSAALALPDEPSRVYLVATGEITNGMEQYTRHDTLPPMADYETLYAVPQPAAPVERQPLSIEQIREWWAVEHGLEDCDMCKLADFVKAVQPECMLCHGSGKYNAPQAVPAGVTPPPIYMVECRQCKPLSAVGRAGIAHAAFGNPIPQAAYQLIDAVEQAYGIKGAA